MNIRLQLIIYAVFIIYKCSATEERRNVLFIIIDDLRNPIEHDVRLPHIQKLARKGVHLKNAFAQQALCAPSRNSLLTGRRPDSLHLYDFYSYWRNTTGNFTTLPQYFKQNGYKTYSAGKVFHPGQSSNYTDDYPYSWSKLPYHPPSEIYKNSALCLDNVTHRFQKNLVCPVNVSSQPGKTLPDLQILKHSIKILKEHRTNKTPFFLAVGFHKPHIPLKYPKEYIDLVPIEKVHPPLHPLVPVTMPLVAWHTWSDVRQREDIKRLNISFPFGTMPNNWTLLIRRNYYAASLYIDDLIGKLIRHVDLNNTIVVITSDHGWSLGENGMWAKFSNFDVALRVPLIIKAPYLKNTNVDSPVELVDLFPTLVELAKLPNNIPQCGQASENFQLCFEGKSLLPWMTRNTGYEDKGLVALSQYPRPRMNSWKNSDRPRLKNIRIMGYSIRTKQYRYTEWISFNNTSFERHWNDVYGIELYDHYTDSEESDNLESNPLLYDVKILLSIKLRSMVESIPNYKIDKMRRLSAMPPDGK